eukprot:9373005-Karenia_brevis.AAC.1
MRAVGSGEMSLYKSTRRTMMRTTVHFDKAMNVIYAEGNETTMKTTMRLVERVQSFLKSRVQDTSS